MPWGGVLGGLVAAAIWPTWVDVPDNHSRDILPGWLASAVGAALVLGVYLRTRGRLEVPDRA